LKCSPLPIHPLIEKLSFIRDPEHWGYLFRTGHIEISEEDFRLIAKDMEVGLGG
jgi:predicted RNA-binding protein